jgi:hypothetical protein
MILALGALTTSAFGQSYNPDRHTQGTTLGQSQNTPQDLANSLVVNNKPKIGKEKKEEVDPKKLVSKKSTDTTFAGGLNDVNLDWTANKMGKPHGTSGDDSKAGQKSDNAVQKDLKAAKSSEGSAEIETKDEKSAAAKSDDKSAEKQADKEKAKTDSDR